MRETPPPRAAERPEMSDAAVVSRSWGMALATLVSRLTGFARIVLLDSRFSHLPDVVAVTRMPSGASVTESP